MKSPSRRFLYLDVFKNLSRARVPDRFSPDGLLRLTYFLQIENRSDRQTFRRHQCDVRYHGYFMFVYILGRLLLTWYHYPSFNTLP
jgi:hypothetical protein